MPPAIVLVACMACASTARREPPQRYRLIRIDYTPTTGTPIEVIGEVTSPGAVLYTPNLTLTQALLARGWVKRFATGVGLSRLRPSSICYRFDLQKLLDGRDVDPELAPGDRVYVFGPPAPRVRVFGMKRPR